MTRGLHKFVDSYSKNADVSADYFSARSVEEDDAQEKEKLAKV
jgi:hypothetical protein